jgi:putative methylase
MTGSRAALERRLSVVEGFREPRADLEQYATPADLASHVVHAAAMAGDLEGRTVLDLGAGTGVFALGAALSGARRVVGVELDRAAVGTARGNERRVDPPTAVDWVRGDAARLPVRPDGPTTVLANPPFGAHRGNRGADRAFLLAAAAVATVSYTVHNEGSREFVRALAADEGGAVTRAYGASLSVPRQFDHHADERRDLAVEVYRIEWDDADPDATGSAGGEGR